MYKYGLAPSLYPRRVTDYKLDIFCPSSIVRDDCGYSAGLTCIHNLCFEQNYENSKKKINWKLSFYSREISLFIAWECLRYVMIDICAIHVMSNLFNDSHFTTSLFLNTL